MKEIVYLFEVNRVIKYIYFIYEKINCAIINETISKSGVSGTWALCERINYHS